MGIFLLILIVFTILILKNIDFKKFLHEEKKSLYSYKRKDFIMSRPEHKFFDILVEIFGNKYYIFPQIHLATILDNKIVGQNWKGAFRHIDEKSVDFVICDKSYIKPLLAIELDDSTHRKENRKERDGEVERILNEADLPILRFVNKGYFDKEEIKSLVLNRLNRN